MNRSEIEQELNALYVELEAAKSNDEQTVCLTHNVDNKQEAIALIEDEIRYHETMLQELVEDADEGMDYIGLQVSQGLPVFMPCRM